MKFAIVHNWPGQKNSELELIKRIARVSKTLGHECLVVDPFGHPLSLEGVHLEGEDVFDAQKYNFCLHLHYVNPNIFDTFSYAVNWNPLDYVVRNPVEGATRLPGDQVVYRAACLESHDALLSAGSDEMDDFAGSLNLVSRQQIVNKSLYLHTTSEVVEDVEFPDFNNFKVFYIGINWERQQGVDRHGSLIERLDATNLVDFYGVGIQYGIPLWEGVRNYKGELPFDGGKSIMERSNQCGVSLALHSKSHRKSGLVSTRIFQACAAKTLTLCDDNPFVLKYFGDCVLTFKYGDDPAENFARIMEKIEWIRQNPVKAEEMARKAHRVFVEKFSLQSELANLFDNHQDSVLQYQDKFCVRDTSSLVDVLYVYRCDQENDLNCFFQNLAAQVAVQTRAIVFSLPGGTDDVRNAASVHGVTCLVVEWTEEHLPLDGMLISHYLQEYAESPWFTVYSPRCRWKRMHLSQLVRSLENGGSVAVSGVFVWNTLYAEKLDEFYTEGMKCIDVHPTGITESDLGAFTAGKFPSSSLLFATADFQDARLRQPLRFFDSGATFFLIAWHYLQTRKLPHFVPKLSTMFIREDKLWKIDSYLERSQTEDFERSIALAFLKNDPYYLSLRRGSSPLVYDTYLDHSQFSVNEYMHNVLRFRPLVLKMYRGCFKAMCLLLKIPYKEVLQKQNDK